MNDKKKKLGQVYTPPKIAKLMAELLMKHNPTKVVEPCFGEGAFLKELDKYEAKVIGIEVDRESFTKQIVNTQEGNYLIWIFLTILTM